MGGVSEMMCVHAIPPPHFFNIESKQNPQPYILQRVTWLHGECHLLEATVLWVGLWAFGKAMFL